MRAGSILCGSMVLVSLLFAQQAAAGSCATYEPTMHWVCTSAGPYGWAGDAEVVDGMAYIADSDSAFHILDVHDIQRPQHLSRLAMPGHATRVAIDGSRALVAGDFGISCVDIADPVRPKVNWSVDTGANTWDCVVRGGYVYVAAGDGVRVIRRDATPPAIVGSILGFPSRGLGFMGDYLLVGAGRSGVIVLDVSNPSAPTIVSSIDTPGWSSELTGVGMHALVADYDGGFLVVDFTNLLQPAIAAQAPIRLAAVDIAVEGSLAMLCGPYGVVAFDVTDLDHPLRLGEVDGGYEFHGVGMANGLALAADGSFGVHLIEVCGGRGGPLLATLDPQSLGGDEPRAVAASGDYAYSMDSNLDIVDLRSEVNPTLVNSLRVSGDAIDATRTLLAVADYHALRLFSLEDPAQPRLRATAQGLGGRSIFLHDDLAFVGGDSLRVLDISDPNRPRAWATLDFPGRVDVLGMDDSVVYVVGGSLWTLDVEDPASPVILGRTGAESHDLTPGLSGRYLYQPADWQSVRVYDVSVATHPVFVRTIHTPGSARRAHVVGGRLVVADQNAGIQIFDLADPSYPKPVGHLETPGEGWSVVPSSHGLVIADGWGGLLLAPLPCTATPASIEDFTADMVQDHVELSWRSELEARAGLRLSAIQDGARRELPFTCTRGGACHAQDVLPDWNHEGIVEYRLELVNAGGSRTILAQESIRLSSGSTRLQLLAITRKPTAPVVDLQIGSGADPGLELGIYSVDGRCVRTLVHGWQSGGSRRITWDRLDSRGVTVASGVYFAHLRSAFGARTQKILLLR
jgi:hypothetical protein